MARIRFYPEDNNLHPSDHIVGTDEVSGQGATRVFTIQALTDYLTSSLNLTAPPSLGAGFVPAADGAGNYVESTILIKDVSTSGTLEFTEVVDDKIILYSTPTGFGRLRISLDVPGGFNIDPSILEGMEFTATGSFGSTTQTITTMESSNAGEFVYRLAAPIDSSIPPLPSFLAVDDISFPNVATPFNSKVTCIGGDTINVGDLEVRGNLISDGVAIDLGQIENNTNDIITILGDVADLAADKADAVDLHPAATIPDPTPAANGVASTAVVSIDIDPVTQVMSVVRGTVPVVIGGTGTGAGTGGDISVQGFTVNDITLANSTEISWLTSTSGSSITLTPTLDASNILSGVESRLDAIDALSLTVGSVTNVNTITAGDGITISGNSNVATINAIGAVEYIEPTDYIGTGSGNLNPFDTANTGILPPQLSDKQLAWLPEEVTVTDGGANDMDVIPSGLWRYSAGGSENAGDEYNNWSHVANLSFQPQGSVDLEYIPEMYDSDGVVIAENQVANITAVDASGNPTAYENQYSLPIASEDNFGLVKMSRYVQDSIQECEVIPADMSLYPKEEYTYDLFDQNVSTSDYTPTVTGNKIYMSTNGYVYTGTDPLVDGDVLNYGDDLISIPALGVARTQLFYSNGIYGLGDSNVISTIFTDPIQKLALSDSEVAGAYLIRETGVSFNIVIGLYANTVKEYELFNGLGEDLPLTAGETYSLVPLRGTITPTVVTGPDPDDVEMKCIEITAPLRIDRLLASDGTEYDLGSSGSTLSTHFEQLDAYDDQNPPDPIPGQLLKLGDTITGNSAAVGSERFGTYMFVGVAGGAADQTMAVDGNTAFRTGGGATLGQWLRIGAGGSGTTVTSGISLDIGAVVDTQQPDPGDSFRTVLGINAVAPTAPGDYVLQTTVSDPNRSPDYNKFDSYQWVAGGGGLVNQSLAFTANMVSPLELDHSIIKDFYQVQVYDENKNMILPNNVQLTSRDDNGTTVPTVTVDFGQADGTTIGFAGTVVVVG